MHPARAKAKQVEALVDTAKSVADLVDQMSRIESKLDEVLSRLPASAPTNPNPKKKD